MKFFVNKDISGGINFWITPDNPSAISKVHVSLDGVRAAELSAWITDDNIRASGWHSTGQCVFNITEKEVPQIRQAKRVEIYDADTNILVYRSVADRAFVQQRLININTSIHHYNLIEQNLFEKFQYSYFGVEKLSEESTQNIMQGPWLTSLMISGSVIYPRYEMFFQDESCVTSVLIHDPYTEMARRMLWLQSKKPIADDDLQRWRLGSLRESVLVAAEYDFSNGKSIKRFLRMLPEPCYRLLYNPLCRQFGTRSPTDPFSPGNSIVAMEIISRVKIVGHSDYTNEYSTALLDRLGVSSIDAPPLQVPPEVSALATLLKSIELAREMVNFDVVISDAVRHAVIKSWH